MARLDLITPPLLDTEALRPLIKLLLLLCADMWLKLCRDLLNDACFVVFMDTLD